MSSAWSSHPTRGWAERTGRRPVAGSRRGGLRFAFYGRVSTEDHQDPVTSRVRQRDLADALVAGHGRIVAGFFDIGQSHDSRGGPTEATVSDQTGHATTGVARGSPILCTTGPPSVWT
jgi:hypothetical protein